MLTNIKILDIFKKRSNLSLFFLILILLPSCRSSKELITVDGSAVNKSNEELIEDILNSQLDYKTISGRISLELIGGESKSGMKVNSQLKIVRDDIIQLSIRMPFINSEVFRLNITPDSIFVIDRMSKRYAAEDLRKLEKNKKIQFNYSNLQSLFTNGLFFPGKEKVTKDDYKDYNISLNSGQYNLLAKNKSDILCNFTVDSSDRITSTNFLEKNNKYSLEWLYSDFIKDGVYVYPTKMLTKVLVGNKKIRLNMSYSNLDFNKDFEVDRSLPSKYEQVSVLELLKNYIK